MLMQELPVFDVSRGSLTQTIVGLTVRVLILGRAAWWAIFALSLITTPADIFVTLSHFLTVDGVVLGLATIATVFALPDLSIWPIPATDALFRIALGYAVKAYPGIPGFPVTATAYLAFVALLFLFDGVTDVVIVIRWRNELGRSVAHILTAAGGVVLALIAIPIATATTADAIRSCLVVVAATQSFLLATAAFEHVQGRRLAPSQQSR
jgi:uncharacterized membrane protein HdeD (DUF308 family)